MRMTHLANDPGHFHTQTFGLRRKLTFKLDDIFNKLFRSGFSSTGPEIAGKAKVF